MAFPALPHTLGPTNASLLVKTYRQGFAARAAHDLVLEVTRWAAKLSADDGRSRATVELTADPQSLRVREARHGVKPLGRSDYRDIEQRIGAKVLGRAPISFRGCVESPGGGLITVSGDLELAHRTRPISFQLEVDPAGHLAASVSIVQSDWDIQPYSALMGALKVRDAVEVAFASERILKIED